MADQMPACWGSNLGDLLLRFLDIVFADIGSASSQGGLYRLSAFGLGRADNGDRFGVATTPLCCVSYCCADAGIVGANIFCHEAIVFSGDIRPTTLRASNTSSIGKPTMLVYDPSTRSTKAEPSPWTA